MWYSFVEIKNFKGIRRLRLDFAKPPRNSIYALVGLNESGKTTILEAINYFSYGAENLDPLELSGYGIPDVHELIPIAQRSNFGDSISITVGLEMEDDDEVSLRSFLLKKLGIRSSAPVRQFTITEEYPFERSRHNPAAKVRLWGYSLIGTRGRQKKARSYDATDNEWHAAIEHLDGLLPRILYFPNFLFDFPDRIYITPGEQGRFSPTERFYKTLLQDILDALDNATNVDKHIVARARSGEKRDRKALEALLVEMGRSVTQNVFSEWNKIFDRDISNKAIKLELGGSNDARLYIRFCVEDADGLFEISERSLGFRWFFVYLLLTLYRGFRKSASRKLLFLFDEPASNLHSTAQHQLLRSFERLGKQCRIIYATHSHHLINPDWLENTYVVRNASLEYDSSGDAYDYNARKTNIQAVRYREFASQHPDQTTYFQPVLDVLDYRPSELENIPGVVMLEGKNDYYALRFAHAAISGAGAELNLLPGGGAGSLDDVLRLYIAWGREFVVLLDSDLQGVKQRDRYVEKFGRVLEDRIFVLADVDRKWRRYQMENLFHVNDRKRIQEIVAPGRRRLFKTHFNRAIQELCVTTKTVNLSKTTINRFARLVAFLKGNLERLTAGRAGSHDA